MEAFEEAACCRALWCAVLNQALADAAGLPASGLSPTVLAVARRRVEAWVGSRDFAEVCDLAGAEPGAVRARLEAALAGVWAPSVDGRTVSGRAAARARWGKRAA
jgi:hypothetical protein